MTPSGKLTSICQQLWMEQRAQIANIRAGAARGDRKSQALLAQIEVYQAKLTHIEELGEYVAAKEAEDAARAGQ